MSSSDCENLYDKRIEWKSPDRERHTVLLLGSWDHYRGDSELEYQGKQVFAVSVEIPVGTHCYRFLVDEENWVTDNNIPKVVRNGIELNQIHIQETQSCDDNDYISERDCLQSKLMNKYKTEMSLRRQYFNMIHEIRGNIRVFCRVRPLLPFEETKNMISCITFPKEGYLKICDKAKEKEISFEFDMIYKPQTNQSQINEDTIESVQHVMDGYNVSIFAYGQTGSGKTYTMSGIQRSAFQYLFKTAATKQADIKYTFKLSVFEIYNEKIDDMLVNASDVFQDAQHIQDIVCGYIGSIETEMNQNIPTGIKQICKTYYLSMKLASFSSTQTPKDKDKKYRKHRIVHTKNGCVHVEGLTSFPVEDMHDVDVLIKLAKKNIYTKLCHMSMHSSRRCQLCMVEVVGLDEAADIIYLGTLYLVDLVGSERVKRHSYQHRDCSGDALGDVIQALQRKNRFVPYRNSTLTDLMSNALGGNAKTIVFINCCPTEANVFETMNSLKFGERIQPIELYAAEKKKKKKDVKT